jgi:ATP-dependent Clp protease ATP-binding subunit ClpC
VHSGTLAHAIVPARPYAIAVFERYSERARQVVVEASDECRARGDASIGTEHLLLALCEVTSVAADVLASLNVNRDVVLAALPPPVRLHASHGRGHLPFSQRAKLALDQAAQRPRSQVAPEQVLLALLRDGASTAAQILADRGVDAAIAEREIVRRLARE